MTLRTLLLALTLSLPLQVAARRVMWGVQAGWDARRLKIDSDLLRASKHSGWFIGPQASLQFARGHLALEASLLYDQRYMDLEERDTHEMHERRQYYLVVPVNLRYILRLGKPLGLFLATGPQWRRYLNRNQHIRFDDDTDLRVDPSTLSWNVGAGVELFHHLLVGFTYNFGIDEECWKSSLGQNIRDFDLKRNSCQVSLTCLF